MLKTDWKSSDTFVYLDYNNILSEFSSIVQNKLGIGLTTRGNKSLGIFLYSQDINSLESAVEFMAIRCDVDFIKKNWYNLTDFSYLDLNRICTAINLISAATYTAENVYASDSLYASDNLLII